MCFDEGQQPSSEENKNSNEQLSHGGKLHKKKCQVADSKNLNKFSDHHSLVDSSAHGFKSNFIRPFLL